mmetsp:Transcript_6947/g.10347  ORF Transcript_6947/g.10347 Transcript_6947/m.10347 type:complete len:227 (+) Transcript_6947:854-1534(+)
MMSEKNSVVTCESFLDELENEVQSLILSERKPRFENINELEQLRLMIKARDATIIELRRACEEACEEAEHYARTVMRVTKREQKELEEAQLRIAQHEERADGANVRARESHDLCQRQEKLATRLEEEIVLSKRKISELEAMYSREKRFREQIETEALEEQKLSDARLQKLRNDLRIVLDEALKLRGELEEYKEKEAIRMMHFEHKLRSQFEEEKQALLFFNKIIKS